MSEPEREVTDLELHGREPEDDDMPGEWKSAATWVPDMAQELEAGG